jgi:hypothetical protein
MLVGYFFVNVILVNIKCTGLFYIQGMRSVYFILLEISLVVMKDQTSDKTVYVPCAWWTAPSLYDFLVHMEIWNVLYKTYSVHVLSFLCSPHFLINEPKWRSGSRILIILSPFLQYLIFILPLPWYGRMVLKIEYWVEPCTYSLLLHMKLAHSSVLFIYKRVPDFFFDRYRWENVII